MSEIEMLGWISGDLHPDRRSTAPNLPTIWGALHGLKIAASVPQNIGMCAGCAYRIGSPANQSPSTTCDADWCERGATEFMCHEDMDDKGEPMQRCIGWAAANPATRPALEQEREG